MNKKQLTPKQREALKEAPLYFVQCEVDPNKFYWTNAGNNKWFHPRTIEALREKG